MYSRANWVEWMAAWHSGQRCEIDEELFEEFLDVLPVAFMFERVELIDGTTVNAKYGFVEGADRITAFWSQKEVRDGKSTTVYYNQYTKLFSRG